MGWVARDLARTGRKRGPVGTSTSIGTYEREGTFRPKGTFCPIGTFSFVGTYTPNFRNKNLRRPHEKFRANLEALK